MNRRMRLSTGIRSMSLPGRVRAAVALELPILSLTGKRYSFCFDAPMGRSGLQSGCYLFDDSRGYLFDGYLCCRASESVDELNLSFSNAASNVDAIGDADEVCVLEFDASTLVAVVEEDVELVYGQVCGDLLPGGKQRGVADIGDGDDNLERSDGRMQREG